MKYRSDDDLNRISSKFLGPKGWTLPFQVRYVCWWVGGCIWIVTLLVVRRMVGLSPAVMAYSLVFTIAVTNWLGGMIDYERPLRSLAVVFHHEVTAPRPPRPHVQTLIPPKATQ